MAVSDLALHLVIIAADNHCREHLLLDAVSPEPMQHRIAPLWNALQQDLYRSTGSFSARAAGCTPVNHSGQGKGRGSPGRLHPRAASHTQKH